MEKLKQLQYCHSSPWWDLKLIPCLHVENAQCLIVSTNEERTKLVSNHYNKVDLILTLNEFLELTN